MWRHHKLAYPAALVPTHVSPLGEGKNPLNLCRHFSGLKSYLCVHLSGVVSPEVTRQSKQRGVLFLKRFLEMQLQFLFPSVNCKRGGNIKLQKMPVRHELPKKKKEKEKCSCRRGFLQQNQVFGRRKGIRASARPLTCNILSLLVYILFHNRLSLSVVPLQNVIVNQYVHQCCIHPHRPNLDHIILNEVIKDLAEITLPKYVPSKCSISITYLFQKQLSIFVQQERNQYGVSSIFLINVRLLYAAPPPPPPPRPIWKSGDVALLMRLYIGKQN